MKIKGTKLIHLAVAFRWWWFYHELQHIFVLNEFDYRIFLFHSLCCICMQASQFFLSLLQSTLKCAIFNFISHIPFHSLTHSFSKYHWTRKLKRATSKFISMCFLFENCKKCCEELTSIQCVIYGFNLWIVSAYYW